MKLKAELLADLIGLAIEKKYDAATGKRVAAIVDAALSEFGSVKTQERLVKFCQPATNLDYEVRNQVIAYLLIEKFWRYAYSGDFFLEEMHAIIYGVFSGSSSYRVEDFVQDFGGTLPTPIEAISGELQRLNAHIRENVSRHLKRSFQQQALFLAELFARIIRVHPFVDGNGRTARMTVQYCLRRWDQPYIKIPKVRNAPSWKSALSMAIDGGCDKLAAEIFELMKSARG